MSDYDLFIFFFTQTFNRNYKKWHNKTLESVKDMHIIHEHVSSLYYDATVAALVF